MMFFLLNPKYSLTGPLVACGMTNETVILNDTKSLKKGINLHKGKRHFTVVIDRRIVTKEKFAEYKKKRGQANSPTFSTDFSVKLFSTAKIANFCLIPFEWKFVKKLRGIINPVTELTSRARLPAGSDVALELHSHPQYVISSVDGKTPLEKLRAVVYIDSVKGSAMNRNVAVTPSIHFMRFENRLCTKTDGNLMITQGRHGPFDTRGVGQAADIRETKVMMVVSPFKQVNSGVGFELIVEGLRGFTIEPFRG